MESHSPAFETGYAIGLVFGVLIAVAILLVPFIFYLLSLQKALNRCSPATRAMEPGMVWLMLIPLFNMVWHFFVVINISKSLGPELQQRGIAAEPEPGKTLGLTTCILQVCGIIPVLGILCWLAGLVCWIMYWVKISGYSKRLATPSTLSSPPPY